MNPFTYMFSCLFQWFTCTVSLGRWHLEQQLFLSFQAIDQLFSSNKNSISYYPFSTPWHAISELISRDSLSLCSRTTFTSNCVCIYKPMYTMPWKSSLRSFVPKSFYYFKLSSGWLILEIPNHWLYCWS